VTTIADRAKTKSRKEMLKARVITVEDVICIWKEQEAKERLTVEKKNLAEERKAAKALKIAALENPTGSTMTKKPKKGGKKVTINPLPMVTEIVVDPEWSDDESDPEWKIRGVQERS
jgi:hypothetical protein